MSKLDTSGDGFIYLASPYSHRNLKVMNDRFIKNCQASSRLFKKGVILFAPIIQSPCMVKYGELDETSWKAWARFDKAIIKACKAVYVLTLPGWQKSVGVTAEIKYAKELNIPVYYINVESLSIEGEGYDYK